MANEDEVFRSKILRLASPVEFDYRTCDCLPRASSVVENFEKLPCALASIL